MSERSRVPARGEGVFVTASGLRLHALRYPRPSARALVLLPGLTCPAVTLEFLALELGEHYDVVTLDYRGRGLSEAPATGYTLEAYAGDVQALISELGLQRPLIVGQALGGRIAPAFDALWPGVASGVVIIDPPLTGPDTEPYATPLASFLREIRTAAEGDAFDHVRRTYPTWSDDQVRTRADWLDTCDERAITETHTNFHREDLLAYVTRMSAPAVFVYGEHSRALGSGRLDDLRAANPRIPHVMVPGSGHLVPYDDLPATVREIVRFADGLD